MYERNIITFPVPVPYSCITIRPIFPATPDQIEAISPLGIFLTSSTLVPVRFAKIRFATLPAFNSPLKYSTFLPWRKYPEVKCCNVRLFPTLVPVQTTPNVPGRMPPHILFRSLSSNGIRILFRLNFASRDTKSGAVESKPSISPPQQNLWGDSGSGSRPKL